MPSEIAHCEFQSKMKGERRSICHVNNGSARGIKLNQDEISSIKVQKGIIEDKPCKWVNDNYSP